MNRSKPENKNRHDNTCTISQSNLERASKKDYIFKTLKKSEYNFLENNLVEVSFKKGEIIAKQGSFASSIIYLSDGLAKVYVENDQESLILKIVPMGNLIGLPALFEQKSVFPYSVATYKDSTAKLIDINAFKKIIKENSDFSFEIMKVLSTNAVQVYGRFFCFEKKQSYGRLADILLCVSNYIFKSDEFELTLSRKELGELSGMSYESVIRIMKKFKEDKLIEETANFIKIINKEKLMQISHCG